MHEIAPKNTICSSVIPNLTYVFGLERAVTDIDSPESSTPLPPGAVVGAGDLIEAAGHPVGGGVIKPGYDPRLTNEDLAPLGKQTWGSYNIFAFWMSDVHSVGGYVTAGSLFALGLASWQVLVSLLVGIAIVYFFCNLVAKPSQAAGVPYPVVCRSAFGVLGANIPAIIRGLIAVAWYGIQTFLASAALDMVLLKLFPGSTPYADVDDYGFLGLSLLGWGSFTAAVGAAGVCVLARHGVDPQVHRLLRSRRLCRDVHALRLPDLQGRLGRTST